MYVTLKLLVIRNVIVMITTIKPLVGLMLVATKTKTVPPISIPVPMTRKTILVTGEIDIGPHDNQNNAFSVSKNNDQK